MPTIKIASDGNINEQSPDLDQKISQEPKLSVLELLPTELRQPIWKHYFGRAIGRGRRLWNRCISLVNACWLRSSGWCESQDVIGTQTDGAYRGERPEVTPLKDSTCSCSILTPSITLTLDTRDLLLFHIVGCQAASTTF